MFFGRFLLHWCGRDASAPLALSPLNSAISVSLSDNANPLYSVVPMHA